MTVRVSIQGERASFHEVAAQQLMDEPLAITYCKTFTDTFAALAGGNVDYALSAIENSIYGAIGEVYDLLEKHDVAIVSETYLQISQCLIGVPGAKLGDITEVYSHPVALAQCKAYLDTHLPNAVRHSYHDTAGSVEYIKQKADRHCAAIAGAQAAELYGMDTIASSIETDKENYTRFVLLSRLPKPDPAATKHSLCVTTAHTSGVLYAALGCLTAMNMTALYARPVMGAPWQYRFYIDVEGETDACKAAVRCVQEQGCEVRVLGSYQKYVL